MLRVVVTIVLPLVLPTALYIAWMWIAHWSRQDGGVRWGALPWLWLAGAGALLLGLMLFVVTVHFGTTQPGVYVPPRLEGGRIVPGHIEPRLRP
jgi:hypothetical protein